MANSKPYRILIVDDHAVVRRGLRHLLESQPGIEVVSDASNGLDAVDHVRKLKPDLVIMDLTMPEMNGLEAARVIRHESPSTDVLVLTMHFAEELAREVLRSGALGYMLKSDADTDLLAAVDHMRHHQPFFTGKLAVTMAQNFISPKNPDGGGGGNPGGDDGEGAALTDREIAVVRLLAEGKSNKEAAAALGVSSRTVESHRNHIMHKMNFGSFSEMIRFAVRSKLVDP
jgi:DNA-binding NarL/FixJ family response regulator